MSVDSDKATCKPREKTMSAKKRSRPTAPSAAPTGVPAPPRPAALPRPAAADNSTAGRAARPRIRITLSPEYQNKLDALTSELGSLEADGLSSTSVIEHLVDTVFYNAFGTKDNFTDAVTSARAGSPAIAVTRAGCGRAGAVLYCAKHSLGARVHTQYLTY
jgi:hypothetical protein